MLILVVVEVPDTAHVLVGHAVGEDERGVIYSTKIAREYFEGLEVDE